MYNNRAYNTLMFKDIFPDYDTFLEIYNDSYIFDGKFPSKRTFMIIFNEYATSSVSSSKESFIRKFENKLFEFYERFEYDIQLKQDVRSGSVDLKDGGGMVQNVAQSPNYEGDTLSGVVDSLDHQTNIKTDEGAVAEYSRKMIYNKPYIINNFIKQFRYLFIKIIALQTTPVWYSDQQGYLINRKGEVLYDSDY